MTQSQKAQRNIFLVDDDQEDREMFSEALLHVSNDMVKLTEISSATKLIETLNNPLSPVPDLIFLDINMPKINGIDCLKKLKDNDKRFKDLNIVIYSTHSHEADVEEAYLQGARRYYVKPTLFDNLKDLIYGALHVNWNTIPRDKFFINYAVQGNYPSFL